MVLSIPSGRFRVKYQDHLDAEGTLYFTIGGCKYKNEIISSGKPSDQTYIEGKLINRLYESIARDGDGIEYRFWIVVVGAGPTWCV